MLPRPAVTRSTAALCTRQPNSIDPVELGQDIVQQIQAKLPDGTYTEQHPWVQSRMALPLCTIDEVQIEYLPEKQFQYTCKCSVKGHGTVSLQATRFALQEVAYSYRPEVSLAFCSLALAMRYRDPVVWSMSADRVDDTLLQAALSKEALLEHFPMFCSMNK